MLQEARRHDYQLLYDHHDLREGCVSVWLRLWLRRRWRWRALRRRRLFRHFLGQCKKGRREPPCPLPCPLPRSLRAAAISPSRTWIGVQFCRSALKLTANQDRTP
ncbi:hypothetical protein T281_03570 [Rhodomicrobium udaipurense JA643]|nr:hypothetical protein T281_03570 [Rhodomicrobium udaipurense JA643]